MVFELRGGFEHLLLMCLGKCHLDFLGSIRGIITTTYGKVKVVCLEKSIAPQAIGYGLECAFCQESKGRHVIKTKNNMSMKKRRR